MSRQPKHFFDLRLSASTARELTDALVIFAIFIITYQAIANWGVLSIFQDIFGVEIEAPSFSYFFGMSLVVFSARRIDDQRKERAKRVAAENNAIAASMRDPLTQLPNRRHFQSEADAALRNANNKMSVLLLGLHQFKKLNEMYGHLGCDQALSQIASRIREHVRIDNILARVGDDEFALCVASSDAETARQIACSLVEVVKNPLQIGIEDVSIVASVGIAQVGRGHTSIDELLRCAHVALSRAKSIHAEYCFFDPQMDAHVRERSLLEKDLRAAVGKGDIRPYYQPIVDLNLGRIVSFESLARWRHEVSGFVSPDVFIPLAEELGLMKALSVHLFREACRDALAWPEAISLSFNFSPSQFSDRSFASTVLAVLHDTGLPEHRLEVEITESALVADLEATRYAMQALHSAGVRMVIDDFGTGYSSFYHLYELQFDKLKIDRRFIQNLAGGSEGEIFVRAIMGLCDGLNLTVVAEGVETETQAAAAFRYGVHQVQGFLFGRAVAAQQVLELLSGPASGAAALEHSSARSKFAA